MQQMGNSRARAVYEANLPDGFLRPQSDQTLEQFIRAKYEKKKYIAKEYVPEKPPEFPEGWFELIEAEKQKKDLRKVILPSHTGFGGGGAALAKPAAAATNNNTIEKVNGAVKAAEEATARPNKSSAQPPKPVGAPKAAPLPAPAPIASSGEADLLGLTLGEPAPQPAHQQNGEKMCHVIFASSLTLS